jgi:hypothetical protein
MGHVIRVLRMRGAMSRRVFVRSWVKTLTYGVSLVPAIVGIVGLLPRSSASTETLGLEIAIAAIMISTSCWLFYRLYFLCSVVVTETGVEQSTLSIRKGSKKRIRLLWEEIVNVSFSSSSFHFLGKDGSKLELNTTLFNNGNETILAVHDLLPGRLQSQVRL